MSCLVSNFINGKDISVRYYQRLETIVTVDRHDWYAEIKNSMRIVYPIIKLDNK